MDNFSNLMIIGECLLDKKRTDLFKRAIDEIVKPNDIVVDAGTGSGVMAMFAAKAGAKKVYAIEIDPTIAKITQDNIEKNNLSSVITTINDDIKHIKLPAANVVIMEMMDTALIAEQQIPAINSLIKRKVLTKQTEVIPYLCETYIEPINYNFNFFGYQLDMPMIVQARNSGVRKHIVNKLAKKVIIASHSLTRLNDLKVESAGRFNPSKNGLCNSILLSMKTYLSPHVNVWETSDMNMPIIIPVTQKELEKGRIQKFRICYELAEGYQTIDFKWL